MINLRFMIYDFRIRAHHLRLIKIQKSVDKQNQKLIVLSNKFLAKFLNYLCSFTPSVNNNHKSKIRNHKSFLFPQLCNAPVFTG